MKQSGLGKGNRLDSDRKGIISLPNSEWLIGQIRAIHAEIRAAVIGACEESSHGELSQVVDDGAGDTIYGVDRVSEQLLVELFEQKIAHKFPLVLIAEGLSGGKITLPPGTSETEAALRVIADPVDGTRCLMYQKRSAWILTGVAPNHGENTNLVDIDLAVQSEIPLVKQHLCDTLWAMRAKGAQGERFNRITGESQCLVVKPSTAADLAHGFCSISRFFSGGKDVLAAIDDEIIFGAGGVSRAGKAYAFEDQYLSTGGQLYELIMGHDRFIADVRPLLRTILLERGLVSGLCCHPYDVCTELIAREAGVLITNEAGNSLNAPLDLDSEVSWAGYANSKIRAILEPLLFSALRSRSMLT
ncbi:MAG: inositol monophosphatase [Acidobacteriaceae bacterium]|nr:inositol monophosphatase [Acidobacteriaceae bacterium]